MNNKTAVIIGYDAVSPLGIDLEEQWHMAIKGESGIGPLTRFPLPENFPVHIAGEVDSIDHLSYPFLSLREQAKWTSPIFRYALLTVQRALEKSGIEITPDLSSRVAVTYSSAIGGLDAVLKADRRLISKNAMPHPFTNPNACINMVGGNISILTGSTGPITSTITACATGLTSIIMGSMLLELGKADIAICGAADFALVEPIVAGFAAMNGAFVHKDDNEEEEDPKKASRPFSINRRGFVISEGAGCIIIATKEFARSNGISFDVEIAGCGMTSDAHHFVAPNLDTIEVCILKAIQEAGITPDIIDSVNAHATSTRSGDKVEFDALKNVFGGKIPPVTANKSLIGHAMGASSAIETVFTVRGMIEDTVLPTINYCHDPSMDLDCVSEGARPLAQEYVLKNAFGFGGCNSCVVFHRTK